MAWNQRQRASPPAERPEFRIRGRAQEHQSSHQEDFQHRSSETTNYHRTDYDRPNKRRRSNSRSPSPRPQRGGYDHYSQTRSPSPQLRYSDRSEASSGPRQRHRDMRDRTPSPARDRSYQRGPLKRYGSPARDEPQQDNDGRQQTHHQQQRWGHVKDSPAYDSSQYDDYVVKPPAPPPPRRKDFSMVGDGDVAVDGVPSQFLLFRNLEERVNESVLAKGAAKLLQSNDDNLEEPTSSKPNAKAQPKGAKPDSIRRAFIVRDKQSDQSWRYGFVEFQEVADAKAALEYYKTLDRFTISSKPVLIDYIHVGVLTPSLFANPSKIYTIEASWDSNVRLEYRDKRAYPSELVVFIPEPKPEFKEGQSSKSLDKPTSNVSNDTNNDEEGKTKKTKAPKPINNQFDLWTRKTAELHGSKNSKEAESSQDLGQSKVESRDTEHPTKKQRVEPEQPAKDTSSFIHPDTKICHLCMRNLKALKPEDRARHEKESALHLGNLKDQAKCDAAVARLGFDPRQSDKLKDEEEEAVEDKGDAYRDRAAERRAQHQQPKKPALAPFKGFSLKAQTKASPKQEEPAPKPSKASSMMAAMGYDASSGKGLGADGSGMTGPLSTNVYASGVGLGAQGSVIGDAVEVAQKKTRGETWQEFKEGLDQKTKSRYEQL